MPMTWVGALVGGSVLIVGVLALAAWLAQSGKTIASVAVAPGGAFTLAVPASAKRRELWIRYRLSLTVPMARGTPVTPGDHYGIVVRLDLAGTEALLARGGLAPKGPAHFGIVDYQYVYRGSDSPQTLATTVKVIDVPGNEATTVSGTIEVAEANQLLEASVWVTG